MDTRIRGQAVTKSGLLPRPVFDLDPKVQRETPPPVQNSDQNVNGATTGVIAAVAEGEDRSADRDDDRGDV